jgi:hypothetical protein
MLKRILKHRVFVTCFATALVFLSLTAMTVPTSSAFPPSSVETEYYTDRTLSEQCGFRSISCDGSFYRTGCLTSYTITHTTPCP